MGGHENVLPSHQLKVGDVVKVERGSSKDSAVPASGILSSVKASSISVSFKDDYPDDLKDGLRVVKLANDVSFKRMRYALDRLLELPKKGSHDPLLRTIFDPEYKPVAGPSMGYTWYNDRLNDIQKEAIAATLARDPVSLIHGPPGTGKTETLVEIVKQLARPTAPGHRPRRILVCAPSNLAVDGLVERLGPDKRFSLVRLGHPARMLEAVQPHSLDQRLVHGEHGALVREIRREIDGLVGQLGRLKGQARRQAYGALKELRREVRQREAKALSDLLQATPILLCTLSMAGSRQLNGQHYDVAIIDEASQALEAECWLPILLADRVIFAGDHQQLPPTVTSEEAARKGLAETLFGKLIRGRGEVIASMLRIQYRMHRTIMQWASTAMYEGLLVAHESVAGHRLSDIIASPDMDEPMMLIDTAGCDLLEGVTEAGRGGGDVESRFNEGEASIALSHVRDLIQAGLSPTDCAIITPYNGQVDLLRSLADGEAVLKGLEIGTVDSFQGREKEAVVISFVRSNAEREIGFLAEVRRTNVAVTRARRHVCLIGDGDTLGRHPFYKQLLKYVEDHGLVDYPQT